MQEKIFNLVDPVIEKLRTDKILFTIVCIIMLWMFLIWVGLSQTKAVDMSHIKQKTTVVWGYAWGSKAIILHKKLIKVWYTDYQSKLIINKCKKFRKTWVVDCIIATASIWKAESNTFKHCYHNNCVGMFDGWKWYKSISDWLNDFMKRYNKYWYNWRKRWWASFFYPHNWHIPLSRYCLAKTNYGWLNFNKTFNYLIK